MRTARKQSETDIYHVVTRGVGRQLIFEDDEDRAFFLKALDRALDGADCTLYAWCLMGNHVHLLLRAPMAALSVIMQKTLGLYAQRFNERHERVGHLFQERFWSEPIEDDAYFLVALRYVHQNPQKSSIATTAEYRWSSYGSYIGKPLGMVSCDTRLALDMFGSVEGFKRFHLVIDYDAPCIDVDRPHGVSRAVPDETLIQVAQAITGLDNLAIIKTLNAPRRDALLVALRDARFSIRQIERITGISRGIIQKAGRR